MPVRISERLMSWASNIDDATLEQAKKTSDLNIIYDHISLMPDAHLGIGATIGSVIPTKNAIIPAAVGVDIGCGMIASQLDVLESQLPDTLDHLLNKIERAIPSGLGRGFKNNSNSVERWISTHLPKSEFANNNLTKAANQLGTMGSGNHFFELCVDENSSVWLVLHSGSRGIGNMLANLHIKEAKKLAQHMDEHLEDLSLAYFIQGSPEFEAYIQDMLWAQEYARENRNVMMNNASTEVFNFLGFGKEISRINCHHNFAQQETYHGVKLWITRKGAIEATKDSLGVIPGSMGTKTFIVRGKGSAESWNSCSHGAGRQYSRTKAKSMFTSTDLANQMEGKIWLKNRASALIDEIPSAYKDIDLVMKDQQDLVEVKHILKQLINYKGT